MNAKPGILSEEQGRDVIFCLNFVLDLDCLEKF